MEMIAKTPNVIWQPMQGLTNAQKVNINNRFSAKISWKRKQSLEMCKDIELYMFNKYGIDNMPDTKQTFLDRDYMASRYGYTGDFVLDADTGEFSGNPINISDKAEQLGSLYYALKKGGYAIYGKFEKKTKIATQIVGMAYTKHRFDPVWNFRKSQLIRKKYRAFFQEHRPFEQYHINHMVLTLPHFGGTFENKRFYARDLLQKFNSFRKTKTWKKYVAGGEYGLEVKKSEKHGLHIHLHALVFQYKYTDVIEAKNILLSAWAKYVGGISEANYYEPIYGFERTKAGRKNKEFVIQYFAGTTYIFMQTTKVELTENSPIEQWLDGLLECIKYHFKMDDYKDDKGNWDIETIDEIVSNSKGLRFYSRFGFLRDIEGLSFNDNKIMDKEKDLDSDAAINGSLDNLELINPFTLEVEENNNLILIKPEKVKHLGKNDIESNKPIITDSVFYYDLIPDLEPKEVMKALVKGNIAEILTQESRQLYAIEHYYKQKKNLN